MAALIGLWRMLMDYWIVPRVMGHELEIHPLLAIFTLMVRWCGQWNRGRLPLSTISRYVALSLSHGPGFARSVFTHDTSLSGPSRESRHRSAPQSAPLLCNTRMRVAGAACRINRTHLMRSCLSSV